MTRINVVPVECLTDKHCLAEYKEITRPFNKVIKRINNGTTDDVTISAKYLLGTGHETFFFDKLYWLYFRYHELRDELIKRGININVKKFDTIACKFYNTLSDHKWWNFYNPTPEDMYLNMARLAKRSNLDNVLNELGE